MSVAKFDWLEGLTATTSPLCNIVTYCSPTRKVISSKTTIGLEVDPPAPFKYFGKSILETTGRLALSIALSEIGNAFVKVINTETMFPHCLEQQAYLCL
jgi:hypothetical protein